MNIEITNPVGLYASPATELVDAVKLYKSHVTLNYNEKSVNMKSLMGVLSLGIPHKAKIEIVVEGEDEGTAMDMIVEKSNHLKLERFNNKNTQKRIFILSLIFISLGKTRLRIIETTKTTATQFPAKTS